MHLFFSIYVNDFAESISKGELHLYADDTKAFVIGNSVVDQITQPILPAKIILPHFIQVVNTIITSP